MFEVTLKLTFDGSEVSAQPAAGRPLPDNKLQLDTEMAISHDMAAGHWIREIIAALVEEHRSNTDQETRLQLELLGKTEKLVRGAAS